MKHGQKNIKTILNIHFSNGGVGMQLKQLKLLYPVSYHGKAQAFVQGC